MKPDEIRPFSSLYLFPYYSSREEYLAKTGKFPKVFDPTKPPKYWEDLEALKSPHKLTVYDSALKLNDAGTIERTSNGLPIFEFLLLRREDAGLVNIPNKSTPGNPISNQPAEAAPEVQMPLMEIPAEWEIFVQFGGNLALRKKKEESAEAPGGFSSSDRALLLSIWNKLKTL